MTERTRATRDKTPAGEVWSRFRRHRMAVLGLLLLSALVLIALLAPWIAPHDPYALRLRGHYRSPSAEHPLGTDSIGRDNLSRLIYGARISLSVGLISVFVSAAIGVTLGVVAGYRGGFTDSFLSRWADLFMSFPYLIVILTLVAVFGPSIVNVMLAIGFLGWPAFFRMARGQCLSIQQREYVLASRAAGGRDTRIIVKHILPNSIAPLIVLATLRTANAILIESSLSFLGMGVRPPTASWGNMLTDAQSLTTLSQRPWLWIPPGLMISIAVLSINFLGDGLRDALDPRTRFRKA